MISLYPEANPFSGIFSVSCTPFCSHISRPSIQFCMFIVRFVNTWGSASLWMFFFQLCIDIFTICCLHIPWHIPSFVIYCHLLSGCSEHRIVWPSWKVPVCTYYYVLSPPPQCFFMASSPGCPFPPLLFPIRCLFCSCLIIFYYFLLITLPQHNGCLDLTFVSPTPLLPPITY